MLYKACIAFAIIAKTTAKKKQQPLVYVHVGKAGGGSVETWLKTNQVKHQTIHVQQSKLCDNKKPRKWLISVRDPVSRAVSAFNWRSSRKAKRAIEKPFAHIGKGLAWYLEHDLECILQQDYRLVHAESMEEDLKNVAKWLNIKEKNYEIPSKKSVYPMKNETYLSDKGRNALEKETEEDYRMLKLLEKNRK